MAEVGQRLGSGVYRLSALRNSQGRPLIPGESPGALWGQCTGSGNPKKEESNPDEAAVQQVSKGKSTRRGIKKVSSVRASESQLQNSCALAFVLDYSRFMVFVDTTERLQAYKTALYFTARLQPLLQENVLPGRMTPWSRGAVSITDTLRTPQQLRAFCTFILNLSEQGTERPEGRRRLDSTTRRSFSWSSDSSSNDAPPFYRSRTAYYDILNVSPSATQSQIKTAYYKQSFIYHPDKNRGSEEATKRFSEISEAYTVLGSISLRRKYDRGILSKSDVHTAGRPSSKETSSRSTASQQQQQQHQQRSRRFSQTGGKPMFDFDAFYRAHYGEQLQREREMRARKQYMEEQQKEMYSKRTQGRLIELSVAVLLAMAGLVFINLREP